MTYEELLEQTPEQFRPVIAEYGPALVKMGHDEIWGFIQRIANGDMAAAQQMILNKMDNSDMLAEWKKINDKWHDANKENASRLKLQREAMLAVLKVLLTASLTLVGL